MNDRAFHYPLHPYVSSLAFARRASVRLALVALALAVLLGTGGVAQAQGSAPAAPRGSWVAASKKPLRKYYPVVASFLARQTTRIGSQVSGRVQKVLVDVGDAVKAGQPLVEIDPAFIRIELAQAKARLQSARANLHNTQLNLERTRRLFDQPSGKAAIISRKQMDDVQAAFQVAQADVALATEGVRYSQERMNETIIRAPYNAVITKRMVDPGEPITSVPVSYLLELAQIDRLELEFSLPQEMYARVHKGTPVAFEAEGVPDSKGRGRIAVVYPVVDPNTRSFRCRVIVENPERRYLPGLLAKVRVVEQEIGRALVVPRRAVHRTASAWQVEVERKGRPVPRQVSVGLVTDQNVEIRKGLAPGERVWVPNEG